MKLTPELYSRIQGHYKRRNVFGAPLSYAPVLARDHRTRAMYDAVVRYVLLRTSPLLREIGIGPTDGRGTIFAASINVVCKCLLRCLDRGVR